MKKRKGISYLFVLSGGTLLLYAQDDVAGNKYFLIAGIILLMLGLYNIWSTLGSKPNYEDSFIKSEEEE